MIVLTIGKALRTLLAKVALLPTLKTCACLPTQSKLALKENKLRAN